MRPEEIENVEQAREFFEVTSVHCPDLDKNLKPKFQLLNSECLFGFDGKCHLCEYFYGAWDAEGKFFSSGIYEGFCNAKNVVCKTRVQPLGI